MEKKLDIQLGMIKSKLHYLKGPKGVTYFSIGWCSIAVLGVVASFHYMLKCLNFKECMIGFFFFETNIIKILNNPF